MYICTSVFVSFKIYPIFNRLLSILTQISKLTAHIVCTMITLNCTRNTKFSKYRSKARNSFLSSVILDSSYNYISTKMPGNDKVTMAFEFKGVKCHSIPYFCATGTKPKLSFLCLVEYLRHVSHLRHISLMTTEIPGQ